MKNFYPVALALTLAGVPAFAQKLDRHPYPQNLDSDSVEILWRTDVPTETWVEVREKAGSAAPIVYSSTVPATAHQISVPGLKPDTEYLYRVGSGEGKFLIEEGIPFRTFPAGEKTGPYSFVAFGDHRNFVDKHRAVVEAIIAQSEKRGWPRFVLDTGDYTGNGELKKDPWNEQFFGPARGLVDRVCYFPIIGNHEVPGREPRIPFRYLENFSVPTQNSGTEYYYSFDYGDAHFTMVDAYSTDFTSGSKQYEWIKQDLKKSNKPWKFVSTHYPVFIHRTAPTVTYGKMEIREHLVPLFEQYGVAAVFSGDSHFYQRSEVNGIAYICTGGGGAPLYDPGNGMDYVRASKKALHYAWVTMDGDKMKLEVFDTNNELIDSMTTGPREAVKVQGPPLNFERRLPDEKWTSGSAVVVESRGTDGKVTPAPAYSEQGVLTDSSAKSTAEGLKGAGSRFSDNSQADARVRFTPPIEEKGTYLLSVTAPDAHSTDAPNTLFEVTTAGGEVIRGKLRLNAAETGNRWHDVGLFELAPGATVTLIEAEEEPDRFYSDGVKLTRMERK